MDYNKEALKAHEACRGKIEVVSKMKLENKEDLSIAYTPGVAEPCRKIAENKEDVYKYTSKGNLVAVLSDGSAVLGLGNIGGEAAMPVMEGKAVLFKAFGNVDAFPICIDTQDIEEIIQTGKAIAPTFGGINLEDIAAPKCFEIEERLQEALNIPVFHDDQHGTAIVVSSGLINALKIVKKDIAEIKVAISGPGAAGTAIAKMLMSLGVKNIIMCDRTGIIDMSREGLTGHKKWLAEHTNREHVTGSLEDAVKGADVVVGVSGPGIITEEMIESMNADSIVFAMANPIPEIMPDLAKKAGARVIGTGRSDFPNQINNVLAFPGIFRGALDARAKRITESMKVAAAYAIAELVTDEELSEDYIMPSPFDKRVSEAVSKAVYKAWMDEKE
ncbi:MAG: NADP-dependent malic enzyme [Eubacterium sp.]